MIYKVLHDVCMQYVMAKLSKLMCSVTNLSILCIFILSLKMPTFLLREVIWGKMLALCAWSTGLDPQWPQNKMWLKSSHYVGEEAGRFLLVLTIVGDTSRSTSWGRKNFPNVARMIQVSYALLEWSTERCHLYFQSVKWSGPLWLPLQRKHEGRKLR